MSAMIPKRKQLSDNPSIAAMELKKDAIESFIAWINEYSWAIVFALWLCVPIILSIYFAFTDHDTTRKALLMFFIYSWAAGPILGILCCIIYAMANWRLSKIRKWLDVEKTFKKLEVMP